MKLTRRSLLKTTGAALAVTSLPAIAAITPEKTPKAIFKWINTSGKEEVLVVEGAGTKCVKTQGFSCYVDPETKTLWNVAVYAPPDLSHNAIMFNFKFV